MNDQPTTVSETPTASDIVAGAGASKGALAKSDGGRPQRGGGMIQVRQGTRGLIPAGLFDVARKVPILWASFILGVVIPSLGAVLYLAFIASDQYVAEARLSVRAAPMDRTPGAGAANALAKLSAGALPQLADQDAHIVAEYLRSRAAVEDIGRMLDLNTIFRRPGLDFWARLKEEPKAEELHSYWSKMLRTSVDGPSGILTISIRAFRPEDARALAEACVRVSEDLVNRISERARTDAVRKAEEEVRRADGLVQQALRDLRAFRDKEGILDPGAAASATSQLLLGVISERGKLQTDMFVMSRALDSNAPTVRALKDRIDAMDSQIEQLRGELTNKSEQARTLSAALVRFEQLEIQRIFAEKLFAMAQGGLERARMRAQQQQVYLTVFVPPYLPEEARYPERLAMSLVIPLGLMVLWSIFALTGLAIEDHLT
jgi:capsular polysaccharide transport system permease protein